MITEEWQDLLAKTQSKEHSHCFVCGSENEAGWRLSFQVGADGSVEASFPCGRLLQGYPGLVHGGVVSSILDSAMTNCLFARGKSAVTGELHVRFLQPVSADLEAVVRAGLTKAHPPLYVVRAELLQNGVVTARATGKFMERAPAT